MNGEWIEVNNAKELPIGSWMVQVKDKRNGKITRHIANRRENVTLVGSHFHFDMDPVIAYYNVEVYSI